MELADMECLSTEELSKLLLETLEKLHIEGNADKARQLMAVIDERMKDVPIEYTPRMEEGLRWFEEICAQDRKWIRQYERKRRKEGFLAFFGQKIRAICESPLRRTDCHVAAFLAMTWYL